jgi:hypothetical protein
LPSGLPDDVTTSADPGGENASQGMWLTASAWLPAELLTALSAVGGPSDHGDPPVAAAFCQGGPLDQLPPGPVLAAFLADASSATTSTSTAAGGASDGHPEAGHPEAAASGRTAAHPGAGAGADGPDAGMGDAAVGDPPAADHADTCGRPAADGAAGPFDGLAGCSDGELIGVIRGWRKQASLAAAGELAAVAELAARRHAQAKAAGEWDSTAIDAADDEIAAALTLTSRATSILIDRAAALRGLPATFAALAAGRIDMPKALVIVTSLNGQDPELARLVEAQVIGRAPAQTTGQLRAALHRALLAAGPDAAERRRETEEKQARIERAPEPGGCTATLAGRYLPVTATVAAWNRITALAHQLRQSGAPGTLDELRVRVYLALLSGQPTSPSATQPTTTPCTDSTESASGAGESVPTNEASPDKAGTASGGTAGMACPVSREPTDDPRAAAGPGGTAGQDAPSAPAPAGRRIGGAAVPDSDGLTGTVNLTIPLTTLLGLTDSPGDLGGFGPITAHTAREIAAATLGAPAVRWCVTVIGENSHATGHGCATRTRAAPPGTKPGSRAAPGDPGWAFTVKIAALADSDCAHERESTHYRPPPSLWHLIQIRNLHCTAPGCRMPAAKCDDDHTLAFEKGGLTCECNLGPLCRHHHRVKQSQGWRLEQPEPGIFAWVTPAGWKYITGPATYA